MNMHSYPSTLLEKAVREFSKLPGIGQKTALRLVLYLLKMDSESAASFINSLIQLKKQVKYCNVCKNISDTEVCNICSDPKRDSKTVCVVENIRDVMSVEHTNLYNGLYHVLGGIISPMDGVGPSDLFIDSLVNRVATGQVQEVIMALSTTMEGDTTSFYLYKRLRDFPVRITTLARGVAIGDELEYADEITLGRSIVNRTLFEDSLKNT